jgi:polyphosphate kinase
MPRNINRRVEILFPLEDAKLKRYVRDEILSAYLSDTAKARVMQPDGTYVRAKPTGNGAPFNSQEWLIRRGRKVLRGA